MINLAATLNFLNVAKEEETYGTQNINAGGDGSGCHGPNCGRPRGSGSREDAGEKKTKFSGPKGKSVPPDLGDVGNIKIGNKKPSAASKAYDVYKEKQEKAALPVPKTSTKPGLPNIQEGDHVLLTKPVEGWNEKTWDKQTFQVGGKCTVHPPGMFEMGGQMYVRIKLPSHGEIKDVPLDHVMLYKKGDINAPKVLTEPPKKAIKYEDLDKILIIPKVAKQSIVTQTFVKTGGTNKKPEGYLYTVMKPKGAPGESGKADPPDKPHHLKGQFKAIVENVVNQNDAKTLTSVFQAQPKTKSGQAEGYAYATNVMVHRHLDTKTATVREVRTGEYGHTFGTVRQYKFNSLAPLGKFMNDKYGINFGKFISTKVPKKKGI